MIRLKPPEVRLSEEELREEFQKLHPKLLGAILKLVSLALRNLDKTPTPDVRMADFARWAIAAEEGYAPRPGLFMEAYARAREEAEAAAFESEPLIGAIQALLERGAFEGTAQELLDRLNVLRGDERPPLGWPRTARALTSKLQRLLPVLQRRGIEIAPTKRVGGSRVWRIEKATPSPEAPAPPSTEAPVASEGATPQASPAPPQDPKASPPRPPSSEGIEASTLDRVMRAENPPPRVEGVEKVLRWPEWLELNPHPGKRYLIEGAGGWWLLERLGDLIWAREAVNPTRSIPGTIEEIAQRLEELGLSRLFQGQRAAGE